MNSPKDQEFIAILKSEKARHSSLINAINDLLNLYEKQGSDTNYKSGKETEEKTLGKRKPKPTMPAALIDEMALKFLADNSHLRLSLGQIVQEIVSKEYDLYRSTTCVKVRLAKLAEKGLINVEKVNARKNLYSKWKQS